ncbi:putative phage related protein [Wolbachia endosymbiont of Cylisticus convexus]|nr:putative phage related protein [Wolbachia endosymbiont of Cylisticus convexus]
MLSDFLTDFNNAKLQGSLIPKGTTVKVKMAIKPGGYENWFTKSYTTGSIYLNAEFTVTEGLYAKRKIFQVIALKVAKQALKEKMFGQKLDVLCLEVF